MFRLMPFTTRTLSAAAALTALIGTTPRLTLAQGGCTASTLRAGDARLASYTPVSVDSLEMVMEREGASRPFGTYTQHVRRTTVDGTPALVFAQSGTSPRGTTVDTIWVEARTWKPLRHVANGPGNSLDVTYRGNRVTGRTVHGDTVKPIDKELPAGTMDYSVATSALRAMPLCEGTVIRAGGYDPSRDEIVETVHRVTGAQNVEIGGAARDVWVTEVTVMGRQVRRLLDRATGRELQWSFSGPGGATLRGTSLIFSGR